MGQPFDVDARSQPASHGTEIARVRAQQHGAQRFACTRRDRSQVPAGKNASRQGITVGVQAIGRQSQKLVARHDAPAVNDFRSFHHADDRSRQIDSLFPVNIRHFRCFTAQKGTIVGTTRSSYPFDDLGNPFRPQMAAGDVVQEEKRLCALAEDVVNAMMHDILA